MDMWEPLTEEDAAYINFELDPKISKKACKISSLVYTSSEQLKASYTSS